MGGALSQIPTLSNLSQLSDCYFLAGALAEESLLFEESLLLLLDFLCFL
jgi:hypothetical protein